MALRQVADAGGEGDAAKGHGGDGPDDAAAAADLPEEREGDDGEGEQGEYREEAGGLDGGGDEFEGFVIPVAELGFIEEIRPGLDEAEGEKTVDQGGEAEAAQDDGGGAFEFGRGGPEGDERLGEDGGGDGQHDVGDEHLQILEDQESEVFVAGEGAELVGHCTRGVGELEERGDVLVAEKKRGSEQDGEKSSGGTRWRVIGWTVQWR